MRPTGMNNPAGHGFRADVGTPQAENLGHLACHSGLASDMVASGRSQAACKTERGRALEGVIRTTPQERWSRGCRGSFWRLQLQQLWQLAPRRKKKSLWSNRFRSSQNTPANTSDVSGRAGVSAPPAPNTPPRETGGTHLTIVYCKAPGHSWRIASHDSEVGPCRAFAYCQLRLPPPSSPHPARRSPSLSSPIRFTTSLAGLRPSASAIRTSAIPTAPCRPCRAARIVAIPANDRPSPPPDSGRSARPSRGTMATIRSAIRNGPPRATDPAACGVNCVRGLWSPARALRMDSVPDPVRRQTC